MRKLTSEQFIAIHNLLVSEGKEPILASRMVQAYQDGPLMTKAYVLAEEHDGDLMYDHCISILQKVYGSRLDKMKPKTIKEKVFSLMNTVLGEPDEDLIDEVVEEWLSIY